VAYGLVAPIVIATLVGYRTPPIGAWAMLRTTLRLCLAPLVTGWVATTVALGTGAGLDNRHRLSLWGLTVGIWIAARLLIIGAERRRPSRVVVLGSGTLADWLAGSLRRQGSGRFEILGFVDDDPRPGTKVKHLGGITDLEDLLAAGGVDRLLVGFSSQPDEHTLELLRDCDEHGVHVDIVPRLFEFLGRRAASALSIT
jgi:FlaA1/EpsC-like NDP-sugar epimerase